MNQFIELKNKESFVYGNANFLDTYQIIDGVGFPLSYIDFAKTLGFGRLCKLFLIYIPMGSHPDSWIEQTKYIKSTIIYCMENKLIDYEPDGSKELLERCVPFAMSENGQYLFWDPQKPSNNELPIYVLGSEMGAVRYAASSLYEFVENCTDNTKVKRMLGTGYNSLPLNFDPIKPWEP